MEAWKEELYHHGILGQKWGKKNGPPYPLGSSDHSASEKKAGWRKSLGISSRSLSPKTYNKSPSKVINKNNKLTKAVAEKSNHRRELELKYRKKGLSNYQARKAADNKIKTEKIILGAAGAIAIAGLTAYGIYKYKDYTTDKLIPECVEFQRMQLHSDRNIDYLKGRNFYASYDKGDKVLYGLYGKSLLNNEDALPVDKVNISKIGGTKVASEKRARDTFERLWSSDEEFRRSVKESLLRGSNEASKSHPLNHEQQSAYNMALKGKPLSSKDIRGKVYDAFNINIVNDHTSEGEKVVDRFGHELKIQGIDAIRDINDIKYSTYRSKQPIIMLKDQSSVYSYKVKTMSVDEVNRIGNHGAAKWVQNNITRRVPYTGGITLSGVGSISYYQYYRIMEYKKDHPNTKLTNSQILKIQARNKV